MTATYARGEFNMPAFLVSVMTWLFSSAAIASAAGVLIFAVLTITPDLIIPILDKFLPVSTTLQNINTSFGAIPSGVLWVASAFRIDFGVLLCLKALVARFLIRRLPIIG